jgi:peptide/nickel transport system ATP-binding protein
MSEFALSLKDVVVEYRRRGLFGRAALNRAVDGVSLDLRFGESLGLVGESGSGKSTTARAALGLERIAAGSVSFDGLDIAAASGRQMRELRARAQLVFQDPYSSLDPSMTVGQSLAEPLAIHGRCPAHERRSRVETALAAVGLQPVHADRRPHEFSGGQRQRICIARAMMLDPSVIVLDEPVSALDVSTQGQILNLLLDLQRSRGTTYLLISHDLSLVRSMTQRTAVMYLGQIVERGPSQRVFSAPGHPYTAALTSAILEPHRERQQQRRRILIDGEVPSPWSPPSGCRFHTRCPFAMDICRSAAPPVTAMEGGGEAACHLHTEGPRLGGRSVLELPAPPRRDRPSERRPSPRLTACAKDSLDTTPAPTQGHPLEGT